MFKLVKKLKALKRHMKNLSWSFDNLHQRVVDWREKLKIAQINVDKDPHNSSLKKDEADTLHEYKVAVQDEEKFLMQKAKIDWLSDGDRNSKFFHAVVKGKVHRSRIEVICNEQGERVEGNRVAEQFVKHFQDFLWKSTPVQAFDPITVNISTKVT